MSAPQHCHICPDCCALTPCTGAQPDWVDCDGEDGSELQCPPCFRFAASPFTTLTDLQVRSRAGAFYLPTLQSALAAGDGKALRKIQREVKADRIGGSK